MYLERESGSGTAELVACAIPFPVSRSTKYKASSIRRGEPDIFQRYNIESSLPIHRIISPLAENLLHRYKAFIIIFPKLH
jgi:hypothetical protein